MAVVFFVVKVSLSAPQRQLWIVTGVERHAEIQRGVEGVVDLQLVLKIAIVV